MAEQTRSPVGDISASGTWSGSAGSRYTLIDDHPDSAGTDYLEHGTTNGTLSLSTASDFTVPAGATNISVFVDYYAIRLSAGTSTHRARVHVSGTSYASTTTSANAAWTLHQPEWTTNPATSAAWTVDQVNGVGANSLDTAFSIAGVDASPTIGFSSAQLRVVYTPSVTADRYDFGTEPQNAAVDAVMNSVTVRAEDAAGDLDESYTGNVTVALTVPGAATLGGTLTKAAVAGEATFDDLTVDVADTYTLTATGSLTSTESSSFDITDLVTIELSWDDVSTIEDGFKIERDDDGGGFVEIDDVAADVTTYEDEVAAGATYTYRIRSYNANGNSAYSNIDTVVVP